MKDINDLALDVACHLAKRDVIIRWEDPPSQSAVGQIVKTCDGDLIIYVGHLTGIETRYKVLIHEIAHAKNDADFIPVSVDHTKPPNSIRRTQQERQSWRKHPRETRAERQAREWLAYAEQHKHKYFTGYQSEMECRLLALLDY